MSFIKKLGVFVLFAISIFLLIILAFSFAFNSFLYPQVYFQAFEKAGVYSYLDENLTNAPNMFIKIPEGGARPLIENLFSNFLDYMRSDTNKLDLSVKIDQEKLRNFFLDSIGNLSECRQNQNPFNEENPCLPRGMTTDEFLDDFLASKNLSFFEKDTVDLAEVYGIEKGSKNRENLDNMRNYIKYYQFSSILLIVILVILFSLIFLLQKPNTRKFLRTLGFILIITSLILITIVYSLNNINLLNSTDQLFESVVDVVKTVLTNKLVIFLSITGIIGLFLVVLSFIINPKET
ncbi:MAG: hypothetical protein AABX23_04715 [Nanoarchaeota archaeon]